MTIAFETNDTTFGAGGAEPYARALRENSDKTLFLHRVRGNTAGNSATATTTEMDFSRWNSAADDIDMRLLASVLGPVLDIGCGPGRMVRAAQDLGLRALGIDVSPAAVEVARRSGVQVLERSVFEPLPLEGQWQTVLLVDGNIGIGGDATALLKRCKQLISTGGEIVVEVNSRDDIDRTYTGQLVDAHGGRSATFPWAEIGLSPLVARAAKLGLGLRQAWTADERSFCRLNILT